MWELYNDLDLVSDIKKKRLPRTRQPVKTNHGRTMKKIFESKLERRRREKPRLGWVQDTENELREMKVKTCRHKAADRQESASEETVQSSRNTRLRLWN